MPDQADMQFWRAAETADHPAIYRAQLETFRITYGREASKVEADVIAERTIAALTAPDENLLEILLVGGHRAAYYWMQIPAGAGAKLLDIYVIAAERGHGIGKMVMSRILDQMTRRGIHSFTLVASVRNRPAMALYESYGAAVIEETGAMRLLEIQIGPAG